MIKKPAKVCIIEAPCKINLHLSVGERRPDGFHSLESLFASLALADTLRFERAGKDGECGLSVHWEVPGEPIPQENNLVFKAVTLFRERTGFASGVRIRLDKRIPAGAGLGGGSSDAASALLAMDSLAGTSLPHEELSGMAARLGSDVPFFLSGGAAFVSGRGEKIEAVKAPEGLCVVLAKPPFSSDTATAYRLLDKVREYRVEREAEKKKQFSKEVLIRSLVKEPKTWPFYNDFLPVFLDQHPHEDTEKESNAGMYSSILAILRKYSASFIGLSGSGSCCFGIYDMIEAAERAVNDLAGKISGRGNLVRSTFFLTGRPSPVLKY